MARKRNIKYVKLEKLAESEDPLHPDNIPVAYQTNGIFIKEPEVGRPFMVGGTFYTSTVKEILSENTFKTQNSIYRWTMFKFDQITKIDDLV